MKVEVSNGELVDKVSILRIKQRRVKDTKKLENINKEFNELISEMKKLGITEDDPTFLKLIEVNGKLWDIEDKIRRKEAKKEFDDEFIELARSVYINNDERFRLKSLINGRTNSSLKEEKEYVEY